MKFYCIKNSHFFTAGKVYEGELADNSPECYVIEGDGGNGFFTVKPDSEGVSYLDFFSLEARNSKKFSEMTAKELQTARNDLQKRLKSTLAPTRVVKLTDEGVFLEGGRLPAEYNAKKETLYIHSRANRYAGGQMSVSELKHAENVLKRFYARAHGFDLGGDNL